MGVWAIPTFRLMFNIAGTTGLCFFACIGAYLIMPDRRWVGRAALGSFGVAMLATGGFLGTSYYYQSVNPKPAFMAQCQLGDSYQACLTSYRQFYPSSK